MTDAEYDSRLEIIGELAARFPSTELTDQNVKGYVWSLSDLSIETLRVAIDRCINIYKFFPVVADIREQAEVIKGAQVKDETGADCIRCYGSNLYIPEDRDVDGYRLPVRRCEPHIFAKAVADPDNMDMF